MWLVSRPQDVPVYCNWTISCLKVNSHPRKQSRNVFSSASTTAPQWLTLLTFMAPLSQMFWIKHNRALAICCVMHNLLLLYKICWSALFTTNARTFFFQIPASLSIYKFPYATMWVVSFHFLIGTFMSCLKFMWAQQIIQCVVQNMQDSDTRTHVFWHLLTNLNVVLSDNFNASDKSECRNFACYIILMWNLVSQMKGRTLAGNFRRLGPEKNIWV